MLQLTLAERKFLDDFAANVDAFEGHDRIRLREIEIQLSPEVPFVVGPLRFLASLVRVHVGDFRGNELVERIGAVAFDLPDV